MLNNVNCISTDDNKLNSVKKVFNNLIFGFLSIA